MSDHAQTTGKIHDGAPDEHCLDVGQCREQCVLRDPAVAVVAVDAEQQGPRRPLESRQLTELLGNLGIRLLLGTKENCVPLRVLPPFAHDVLREIVPVRVALPESPVDPEVAREVGLAVGGQHEVVAPERAVGTGGCLFDRHPEPGFELDLLVVRATHRGRSCG